MEFFNIVYPLSHPISSFILFEINDIGLHLIDIIFSFSIDRETSYYDKKNRLYPFLIYNYVSTSNRAH